MSGTQRKRTQNSSADGASFLGLVPFGAGVFLAVLVLQALLRPPAGEPAGTAKMASAVLGAVGPVTALAFALGCCVLGVRWFLSGRPAAFWNHLTGIAGIALSLALISGACVTGAGGALGSTFPRLIGSPLGSILGFLFGLGTLAATLHLSWLQGSTALEPLTRAVSERLGSLFKGRQSSPGKPKTGAARAARSNDTENGVTPAEAQALLPSVAEPASAPEAELEDEVETAAAPTPIYPEDVKKHGGIPEGATPLTTPAERAHAPAEPAPLRREDPAPDPIQSSTVYRWTPGDSARSGVPADEDLAADAPAGGESVAEVGAGSPAGEQPEPAPVGHAAAGLTSEPEAPAPAPEAAEPDLGDVTRGIAPPPLRGRPIPTAAQIIAPEARPTATPPRPRWERIASGVEGVEVAATSEAAPSPDMVEDSALSPADAEVAEPTPELDPLAQLEADLEASVQRFEAELAGAELEPAEEPIAAELEEEELQEESEAEYEDAAELEDDEELEEEYEQELEEGEELEVAAELEDEEAEDEEEDEEYESAAELEVDEELEEEAELEEEDGLEVAAELEEEDEEAEEEAEEYEEAAELEEDEELEDGEEYEEEEELEVAAELEDEELEEELEEEAEELEVAAELEDEEAEEDEDEEHELAAELEDEEELEEEEELEVAAELEDEELVEDEQELEEAAELEEPELEEELAEEVAELEEPEPAAVAAPKKGKSGGSKKPRKSRTARFAPALRESGANLTWIGGPRPTEDEPPAPRTAVAGATAPVQGSLFARPGDGPAEPAPEHEPEEHLEAELVEAEPAEAELEEAELVEAELGASEPLEEPEHVLVPQQSADPDGALKLPSKLAIDAADLFLERERVAVSMLQRQFGIDFEACCGVLDELQEHGLIGPYMGGQQRDILMTRDEWTAHVGQD